MVAGDDQLNPIESVYIHHETIEKQPNAVATAL